MKKSLSLIIVCLLTSCAFINAQSRNDKPSPPSAAATGKVISANNKAGTKTQLQYFIIKGDSGTYGYNIFANGNLYVHQPVIPAINGDKGFADTTRAGSVARLVIQKIKQGEIPPTITIQELKELNVPN